MESFTATIITVAPSNAIEYLQDFMKSTFAKLGFTITHFHTVVYQNIFVHIKFDFHIDPEQKCAIRMLNELKNAPIEITHIPGHRWSMSL